MRNLLLITAMLFSMAAAASAADQKKNDAQPQSQQQTELTQMARSNTDVYASSTQSNCESAARPSPAKRRCENSEGDPQASQNHVEYNGT